MSEQSIATVHGGHTRVLVDPSIAHPQSTDNRQQHPPSSPQDSPDGQTPPNHEQVHKLYQQGLGYRRLSDQTGYSITQVRRILGKLPEPPRRTGTPPSTRGALSKPSSAPQLTDLEARVTALESVIKALQARESLMMHPVHPNGTPRPTKKRGFVIREDLSEAIDRFAEMYHLEIRAILDAALCEFFERRGFAVDGGWEVRDA